MPRGERWRLLVLGAAFFGFAVLIAARLFTFQVQDHAEFVRIAAREHSVKRNVLPNRGALLDRNGKPIAVSVMYDNLYVVGREVRDVNALANQLGPILEVAPSEIAARIDPSQKLPTLLATRLPAAKVAQITELGLPALVLQRTPARTYPEGSLAAQVLGFVGVDGHGLAGLELAYDEQLGGQMGTVETESDTIGGDIALAPRNETPPRDGVDLVLTIDRYLQRYVEQRLAEGIQQTKAQGGLAMVMDPRTGGLLAMATLPTYDLTADEIYDPEKAANYRPVPVTDIYEPGSVMKLITMAAGIEEGVVTPSSTIEDTGTVVIDGVPIRNWDFQGHGTETMTEVLIYSSNVGAQHVSGLLGPERFYRYLDLFGFGQPTGIGLEGEQPGFFRRPGVENWTRLDLATNAFGQGIAVTPIQMITAVSALANDGVLMRPRLVEAVIDADGRHEIPPQPVRRVVSAQTARTLREMMVAVWSQKALRQAHVPGYRIAGKTGTADFATRTGYNSGKTHASAVAMAPAEDPRFVIMVRLNAPEGQYGVLATPIVRDIAETLFRHLKIPPTQPVPTAEP